MYSMKVNASANIRFRTAEGRAKRKTMLLSILKENPEVSRKALVDRIGVAMYTIRKYMQLITAVQAAPQVLVSKSPLGRGHVYRRTRAPYTRRTADG